MVSCVYKYDLSDCHTLVTNCDITLSNQSVDDVVFFEVFF